VTATGQKTMEIFKRYDTVSKKDLKTLTAAEEKGEVDP